MQKFYFPNGFIEDSSVNSKLNKKEFQMECSEDNIEIPLE